MDLETGRQVAIKLPHPEMESDEVFFEREQEIGQHPHPSRNYMQCQGLISLDTDSESSLCN
jgi:hypothetical protein